MKKIIALVLALFMMTAAVAELDGGWYVNPLQEGETSEETVFVDGQIAVLATQIVAGTNYCILVRTEKAYQLVYVYEALDGHTEILKTDDLLITDAGLVGGWALSQAQIDARLFAKATETLMGASYELVTTLGTQVVAGTNYMLLCQITPVVPDAVAHYAVVTVYADLSGNAQVTDVTDIDFAI